MIIVVGCKPTSGTLTTSQQAQTTTQATSAPVSVETSAVIVVSPSGSEDDVWLQILNTSPIPIVPYRPTFLPPQFFAPKLEDLSVDTSGKPNDTVVYTAPDAVLAMILNNGAGALGNLPPFPPSRTEILTIDDAPATLEVIPAESQVICVSWQHDGDSYSMKCYGDACTVDDMRRIASSLKRLDPK